MKPKTLLTLKTPRKKKPFPIKSCSPNENYPYITYTENIKKPFRLIYTGGNNSKTSKKIIRDLEPESLYENSIQLKQLTNKLKNELKHAKSEIYKRDIELQKKNKIIEDCTKNNYNDNISNETINKCKESTLLTLCKEKYNELKKNYKKKCEECESLISNCKFKKIREIQLENEILKNELEKNKKLYLNLEKINEMNVKEIEKLKEYKNKYLEQNKIINSYQKNYETLNNNNQELKIKLNNVYEEIGKNSKIQLKLKDENKKLKLSKEKNFSLKKEKENLKIQYENNEKKILELKKELNEYKLLYKQKDDEVKRLNKLNCNENNKNEINLKPFDYESIKSIEESPNKFISQEKYYLISHKNKKLEEIIKKYENFLLSNNINPKTILDSSNKKIVISKVINYSKDGKNNILWKNLIFNSRKSSKKNITNETSKYYEQSIPSKFDLQNEDLKTNTINQEKINLYDMDYPNQFDTQDIENKNTFSNDNNEINNNEINNNEENNNEINNYKENNNEINNYKENNNEINSNEENNNEMNNNEINNNETNNNAINNNEINNNEENNSEINNNEINNNAINNNEINDNEENNDEINNNAINNNEMNNNEMNNNEMNNNAINNIEINNNEINDNAINNNEENNNEINNNEINNNEINNNEINNNEINNNEINDNEINSDNNQIFENQNDNAYLIIKNFKKNLNDKNQTISEAFQQFIVENNRIKAITRSDFINVLKNNNILISDSEENSLYDKFKIKEQFNNDDEDYIDIEKLKKEIDKILLI